MECKNTNWKKSEAKRGLKEKSKCGMGIRDQMERLHSHDTGGRLQNLQLMEFNFSRWCWSYSGWNHAEAFGRVYHHVRRADELSIKLSWRNCPYSKWICTRVRRGSKGKSGVYGSVVVPYWKHTTQWEDNYQADLSTHVIIAKTGYETVHGRHDIGTENSIGNGHTDLSDDCWHQKQPHKVYKWQTQVPNWFLFDKKKQ